MSEELLPCPFCGGKAEFETCQGAVDWVDSWVRCTGCGCQTKRIESDRSMREDAANLWNSRTGETADRSPQLGLKPREAADTITDLRSQLAAAQKRAEKAEALLRRYIDLTGKNGFDPLCTVKHCTDLLALNRDTRAALKEQEQG